MCIAIQKKKKHPFKPFKSQYNTSIAIQFFHCTPLYCNTIFLANLLLLVTIQFFQPSLAAYCNTTPLLQYNSNPTSLLLQYKTKPTTLARLQYNCPIAMHLGSTALPQSLSHNTKLSITIQFGQWPKTVSSLFFSLLFFFHINFQLLENTKKKFIYLFFFLNFKNTQINS